MDQKTLNSIIHAHEAWLRGEPGGAFADLRGADLRYKNLRGANLRGADLRGAGLYGANLDRVCLWNTDLHRADLKHASMAFTDMRRAALRGACLRGACLRDAVGNGQEVKSLQVERWSVVYTHTRLQIGLENHPIEDWWQFSDPIIAEMAGVDIEAWESWHKWWDTLRAIIEKSPATPTI